MGRAWKIYPIGITFLNDLFLVYRSLLVALYGSAPNLKLPFIQLQAIVQAMTSADRICRAA